jgi:hypothetical protein
LKSPERKIASDSGENGSAGIFFNKKAEFFYDGLVDNERDPARTETVALPGNILKY